MRKVTVSSLACTPYRSPGPAQAHVSRMVSPIPQRIAQRLVTMRIVGRRLGVRCQGGNFQGGFRCDLSETGTTHSICYLIPRSGISAAPIRGKKQKGFGIGLSQLYLSCFDRPMEKGQLPNLVARAC